MQNISSRPTFLPYYMFFFSILNWWRRFVGVVKNHTVSNIQVETTSAASFISVFRLRGVKWYTAQPRRDEGSDLDWWSWWKNAVFCWETLGLGIHVKVTYRRAAFLNTVAAQAWQHSQMAALSMWSQKAQIWETNSFIQSKLYKNKP